MLSKLYNMDNMDKLRTISASDAKQGLGELLASLPASGPVQITRNGRAVAVLVAAPPAPSMNLSKLATMYARGEIEWRRIADETGASFGELLVELGRQGLALPVVTAKKSAKQAALFDSVLRRVRR